jgi:PHP family Zn ribbon phosphoesterase
VEELADRSTSFIPDAGCTKFVHLLPLHEVIAAASGGAEPSSKMVWEKYNRLVGKFGTEFRVMLDVPEKDLADEVGLAVADLIMKARSNRVPMTPGYDGTYGKIALGQSGPQRSEVMRRNTTRLEDYL